MEVAVCDVAVAEDAAAELVYFAGCDFYYFVKIFRLQRYIKFEGLYY